MSKFHVRLSVAAILAVLGFARFGEANPIATPITGVTGWAFDVIYNGGGSATGLTPFDSTTYHDYLASQAATGSSTTGLPTGGAVTISGTGSSGTPGTGNIGDQFQFQSYTGNNAIQWGPGSPGALTSAKLTLGTPASYSTLSFLWACADSANATGTDITVTYTDNTTDVIAVSPPPNWNGAVGDQPLTGMDYGTGASSVSLVAGSGGNGIGLTEVTTPTLDTTRMVKSVTFSNVGSPTQGTYNVLAISGVVPEPSTLASLLAPAVTLLVRRRRRA
jgi:hypothetical protein